MSRLTNTFFSIVAIVVLIFISNQASRFGLRGLFVIVPYLMILMIVVGLIRTWLRG